MKAFQLLIFVLVLVASSGCFGKSSSSGQVGPAGPVQASVTGGGRVMVTATALVVGAILLANTLPVGTENGDIRFRIDGNSDVGADVSEVQLAPGETRQVMVRALNPLIAVFTLAVIAEYVVGGLTRDFALVWTNEAFDNAALYMMAHFGNNQLAALWFASAILAPIALLIRHSSNLVPRRQPSLITEIRMLGAILLFFTLAELQQTFAGVQDNEAFPLGQGQYGYTVKAEPSVPLTEGEYCTFWMSVSDDIPLADPTKHYTYAFVMDSDTNPANNYVASPNFPNDFFKDTDRWYELTYDPTNGWRVTCKVVGPGNSVSTVPSAAHMVINGDSILLFVPRSEFVVAKPPFRATSFCHNGDYGLNPPHEWAGDPTPSVDDPLHAWQ